MPRSKSERERRTPIQRRSRELVSCIRQAAAEILEKQGPAALTTNNIARRAGVSIGSLYQYFSNKEEILALVYQGREDPEREDAKHMAKQVGKLPLREVIRQIVARNVRRHRRNLSIHPQFYREHHDHLHVGTRPEDYAEDHGVNSAVDWVRELFETRGDELKGASPRLAAVALAYGLTGTLHGIVEHDPELLFEDDLIDKLTNMLCACLLDPVGSPMEIAAHEAQGGRAPEAETGSLLFDEDGLHGPGHGI